MKKKFSKILIANRGEIALRIIRAARKLDIKTVAIYARGENAALHVHEADEAVCLGEGDLKDTYLNQEKILFIAKGKGADAIHPGYGFLSENAQFALSCKANDIVFIGPSSEVLEEMGNKVTAKEIAKEAGVAVLESHQLDRIDSSKLSTIKYPALIKAAYGGGGKGMQVVHSFDELKEKYETATRSAENYFGNGKVYLESFVQNARHIEVQLLGDHYGNLVHLYERDCTIQRNHQKIIEEAPALCISKELRGKLHEAALQIGQAVQYENAGTVEFLIDGNDQFFFLEMNPRIQVEHPVTEEVTGVDIVVEQLNIASGNPLSFAQKDITLMGHAIEARIYQEDPVQNFSPSTHPITFFQFPDEIDLRIESDLKLTEGNLPQFDPLLAKFIVESPTRELAILNLSCSLTGVYVDGPATNVNYLNAILNHPDFYKNSTSTRFCETEQDLLLEHTEMAKNQVDLNILFAGAILFNHNKTSTDSIWGEIGFWRMDNRIDLEYENQRFTVHWKKTNQGFTLSSAFGEADISVKSQSDETIILKMGKAIEFVNLVSIKNGKTRMGYNGFIYDMKCLDLLEHYPEMNTNKETDVDSPNIITSHLHGRIVAVNVSKEEQVNKGQVLLVIESMKSENRITAPKDARIDNITVAVGSQVTDHMPLVYLKE